MKKLGDIIDEAMDGEKPDYDDLRYAVCAMSSLMTFYRMSLSNLVKAERENKKKILSYSAVFQYEEMFNTIKKAFSKSPKEWLGADNDPDSLQVQERRKSHLKIVEKIIAKMPKDKK